MKLIISYAAIILLALSCKQSSKRYPTDVGYIDPANALGDPNFTTCANDIYEYYNSEPSGGYLYGKKALRDTVLRKFSYSQAESGFLTFRFVVNCKGQPGRYIVIENDLELKPKKFNEKLVSHLLEITQSFKEWKLVILENQPRDYYIYVTYKLKNGKIIEILP